MTEEDTKEALSIDSRTGDSKASVQVEEREKEIQLPRDHPDDQTSQELPVKGVDRVAENDPVPKEDKDSEEQQSQDDSDDTLGPPIPPAFVYKGRPLGPTAGGAGNKPRPKPGPR